MALTDNLVAYWKFDGNSNDSVASNNGSDTDVSYGAGKIVQAGTYNGTSSFTSLATSAALTPTSAFSISMWIKTASTTDFKVLFQSWSQNTNMAGFRIYLSSGVVGIQLAKNTGTTNNVDYKLVDSSTNIGSANAFRHVVCTYDGSNVKVYISGTQEANVSWTGLAYAASSSQRIGCGNQDGGTNQNFAPATFDEIGLWSRALAPTEVGFLYNAGAGRAYPLNISGRRALLGVGI